ncbi:HU family DNA-binding protein [Candidatus Nesciobacter abundans]|uniref:HU family DNA-binding protein n=1 Tax=Candidatus Nesciobacter abundans TaxID=2601668 RepID=A0A5C0UGH3_9PROT|nr:HU family DNA-binding protein [Candidatus Nesciobacter abundans]QEK39216.1 HU family DNA-binding protein [Candidatus Nesciobacter abundans]
MNKTELCKTIGSSLREKASKDPSFSSMTDRQVTQVMEEFMDTILSELKNGNEVSISSFGKFYPLKKEAREGRNPKTGKTIQIPKSIAAKFKAFQAFLSELNDKD